MISHCARGPGKSGGFTLLELLLAFVVFALSFATILEIVAGSMRSTVRAREYSEAALLAQSIMETVGSEIPIEPGGWEGESLGGYRWTMDITDFEGVEGDEGIMEVAAMNGMLLYWVDLNMEWGEGRRAREFSFSTVRSTIEIRRRQ